MRGTARLCLRHARENLCDMMLLSSERAVLAAMRLRRFGVGAHSQDG